MSTNWVLLPVPEQDHAEFRQTVEDRQRHRGEPTSPTDEELTGDALAVETVRRRAYGEHKVWPAAALARLAEGSTLTTQRWAKVIDLCAEAPENDFSTEEVAARTGLSVNEWRSACRKMTPHLKAHYGDVPVWERDPYRGDPVWPLVTLSGRSLKVHDQLYVGITKEQARLWKQVR